MDKNLKETASKIQKVIWGIIGTIGGVIAIGTLFLGLYCIIELSATVCGLLLALGMVPMDILLTILAMKSVTVEYAGDEEFLEDEEDNDYDLTLIKCDDNEMEEELDDNLDDCKVVSSGIAPVVHLEFVSSNEADRGYARRRVMREYGIQNKN